MYSHLSYLKEKTKPPQFTVQQQKLDEQQSLDREKNLFLLLQLFLKINKCNFPYCVSSLTHILLLFCAFYVRFLFNALFTVYKECLPRAELSKVTLWRLVETKTWRYTLEKTVGDSNVTLTGRSCSDCPLLCSCVIFIALEFYRCWLLIECWCRLCLECL